VLDSVPSSRRRFGRRRSWLKVAVGVIAAALIAAGVIYAAEHIHLGGSSSSPSNGGTEVKLPADAASEFDPSPGDGRETGTERLAVDSNPTGTDWTTEHYSSEDFGGLKDGVGLAIDAGATVPAESMQIRSPTSGYDAEIYTFNGAPPSSLSDWGQPVAAITDGGGSETVALPGRPAKAFLIWITKLPQAKDDPGQFQMEISDVRLTK
jgi:hypothetical protein